MKSASALVLVLVLALAGFAAGCGHVSSYTKVKTTSDERGTRVEAILRGAQASVKAAGDTIEIAHGSVSVNGVPYGAVPEGAQVEYHFEDGARTLSVDGEPRSPAR